MFLLKPYTPSVIFLSSNPQQQCQHFIYHGIEHERVSHGNEPIAQEALEGEESPARLDIRQTLDSQTEATLNQEYVYEFANGPGKAKPVRR